jgi:chromosome segregation ATPase
MKIFFLIAFAILISLQFACSLFKERQVSSQPAPLPDAKYAKQDLDSLLSYGHEIAKLNSNERLAECIHIQELGQTDQKLGWVLHLILIQAVTEDCGDGKEILSRLKKIITSTQDERLRQFLAFQEQVFLRLENKIELSKSLNRQLNISKQEILKSHREIKTRQNEINNRENEIKTRENEIQTHKNEMKSRDYELKTLDNEMKRLQNKLDLLKSIELNLGNPPQETNETPATDK